MNAITVARLVPGSPAELMARIEANGAPIEQADISSITYSVFDVSTAGQPVVSGHENASLEVTDVIFDTLQADGRWTVDDTGYNFRASIAGTAWPANQHRYQVEVKFTPVAGPVYVVPFIADTSSLYGD